jgi:hypothetical protein
MLVLAPSGLDSSQCSECKGRMNEAARDGKDKIDAKIFSYIIPPSTRAPRTKQAKEQPIEWLSEQVQGSDKMRKSTLSIRFWGSRVWP